MPKRRSNSPREFVPARCAGEDGIWTSRIGAAGKGGETDGMPGSTDYNLSGSLTVTHVVWTVNLKSERGVLRGVAELVSQALPGVRAASDVRGIADPHHSGPSFRIHRPCHGARLDDAATRTDGKADGGSLLANVEFEITPGFAANGEFGSAVGFPDYSVADNNLAC